jgi:hypothetical protein
MLDPTQIKKLLDRLQQASLLYPVRDVDDGKARLEMWSAALNAEGGVSVEEATAAAVSISRLTGAERLRVAQPGHLLEWIFAQRLARPRRPSHELPPAPTLTVEERRENVRRGLALIQAATAAVRGIPGGGERGSKASTEEVE